MELKHIMNIPYPSQSQWSSTVPRKIDKISEQNCAQAVPHACTLTSWSLGSPAAQLLGKQFVQTKSDKYIKASHYWPIVKESTSERWDGFHLWSADKSENGVPCHDMILLMVPLEGIVAFVFTNEFKSYVKYLLTWGTIDVVRIYLKQSLTPLW